MKTTSKTDTVKFSSIVDDREVQELTEQMYEQLIAFVKWLSSNSVSGESVMMDYDEIVGELMLELVKGCRHYSHLSKDKLAAVLRRMMDNRISELRYRYYKTHRIAERTMEDLYSKEHEALLPSYVSVEELVESNELVHSVRERISDKAKIVFDALIFGNERMSEFVRLSEMRRIASGKPSSKHVKLTKSIVANSTVLSERDVYAAYREIRLAYREVCNA